MLQELSFIVNKNMTCIGNLFQRGFEAVSGAKEAQRPSEEHTAALNKLKPLWAKTEMCLHPN